MQLTRTQCHYFEKHGYVVLHRLFSAQEVQVLMHEVPVVMAGDAPGIIRESNREAIRSVYGSHKANKVFEKLSRHPRLVQPAMQILGGPVYVHQFKINAKQALNGEKWEWHQDYIFWRDEDGMASDRAVNVVVYLDHVTEFNGPLVLLPGSHKEGVIEPESPTTVGPELDDGQPHWMSHLSASLKYSLSPNELKRLLNHYQMIAPKGHHGSVLMFHPNLVHGSAPNISPFNRTIVIITFNSVANALPPMPNPRPEFLASRTSKEIVPVADDVFTGRTEKLQENAEVMTS